MENLQKHLENSIHLDIFTLNLLAELQDEIIHHQSAIEKKSQEITLLEKKVAWFKEQFKLANQRQFGKSSETSESINLSLFDEKIGAGDKEATDELKEERVTYTRIRKKKSTGRHFDISRFPKRAENS